MAGFAAFHERVRLSKEEICSDFLTENRECIRIKKDATAVKNLLKIFDATLAISNRKGFQAMSVRDLSRETGLSMGALYSYIRGKQELLDMIRNHGSRILMRFLCTEIEKEADPHAQLVRAIETHLYLSEALGAWFYFAYMETKNLEREERRKAIEMELATEELLAGILRTGQGQGIFRPVDPSLTAAALKALLQDWYLKTWKHRKRGVTVDVYARFLIGLIDSFVLEPADSHPGTAGEGAGTAHSQ